MNGAAVRGRVLDMACGETRMFGILHEPPSPRSDLGILFVVGGPQYRVGSHRQFVLMARDFAAAGYPVLRFDYRGMGDSDGARRSFEDVDEDIQAAVDALCSALPAIRRVVLFGLCDAASAVLMYCGREPRIKGVMIANPWVRTEGAEAKAIVHHYYRQRLLQRDFWLKLFSGKLNPAVALKSTITVFRKARRAGVAAASTGRQHFIDRMRGGLQAFAGPVLLLMSGRDLTAREFQDLCKSAPAWGALMSGTHVSTVDLADADHTFSTHAALRAATAHALEWLDALGPRAG
jgi:exosortase A-associated hydrolase 1